MMPQTEPTAQEVPASRPTRAAVVALLGYSTEAEWYAAARAAQDAAWEKQQAASVAFARSLGQGATGVDELIEAVHIARLDMEGREGQARAAAGEIASLSVLADMADGLSPEYRAKIAAEIAAAKAHAAKVREILDKKRMVFARTCKRLERAARARLAPRMPLAASRRTVYARPRAPRRSRRARVSAVASAGDDPAPSDEPPAPTRAREARCAEVRP